MKCKLLRMSLLCLLFLFIFCISVSFASVNFSNFTEFNYLGTREEMFNQLLFECTGLNITDFGSIVRTNDLTNWNNILNEYNSNTYVSVYFNLYHTSNSNLANPNHLTMMYFNNNDWNSGSGYNCTFYKNTNGSGYVTRTSITSQSLKGDLVANYQSKFIFVNNKWYYANNSAYSPVNPIINLTYNNFKTSTISVNYSGDTENFIKADYSKNLSSWRLGNFSNFDISEVDTIYGYLASFQGSSDSGGIYSDVIASFQWKKDIGTYSNGLSMPDTSEHAIYLNSSRIYYNQGYTLYFNAYKNGVEQEISNQFTYLYFVPLGDTSTSGELINPDANTNLDWDFINSIEHLYDSPSGNTAFIINNYNTSGDILGFTYSDYDQWGFGDFIKVSFNNLLDALYNYDNTSFDLGILGVHNSSEFIVSNNALITIVSLFSNCFLLLSSIAWFFYTICAIGVLDLDKIIKDKADLGLF